MSARARKLSEVEQISLFVESETAALGLTTEQLEAWRPDESPAARKPRKGKSAAMPKAPVAWQAPCERVDWWPGKGAGRSWTCSPEDGEPLCSTCVNRLAASRAAEARSNAEFEAERARVERLTSYELLFDTSCPQRRSYSEIRLRGIVAVRDELFRECPADQRARIMSSWHPSIAHALDLVWYCGSLSAALAAYAQPVENGLTEELYQDGVRRVLLEWKWALQLSVARRFVGFV